MQSAPADQPIEELAAVCEAHGASFVYHAADPQEGEMLLEVRSDSDHACYDSWHGSSEDLDVGRP